MEGNYYIYHKVNGQYTGRCLALNFEAASGVVVGIALGNSWDIDDLDNRIAVWYEEFSESITLYRLNLKDLTRNIIGIVDEAPSRDMCRHLTKEEVLAAWGIAPFDGFIGVLMNCGSGLIAFWETEYWIYGYVVGCSLVNFDHIGSDTFLLGDDGMYVIK